MKQIVRAVAFLAMLLPGIAAAQCTYPGPLPTNTVLGRLGAAPGPCQAIPFSILGPQIQLSSKFGITTVLTNTTLDSTYGTVLCNAASGAITITIPSAVSVTPKTYTIKKIDSTTNACTIMPPSGQIDTQLFLKLDVQSQSVTLDADTVQWWSK